MAIGSVGWASRASSVKALREMTPTSLPNFAQHQQSKMKDEKKGRKEERDQNGIIIAACTFR